MTKRPAIKTLLIEAGILVLAIVACTALLQMHLWQARGKAVAENGSNMAAVIHALHNRPNQNLPVQDPPAGPLY